ncbi:MAG: phage terminase small subunit P27 family [Clostridia bacterium]
MSKSIPVALQTGHRTKEELENRKQVEELLKGSNDRVEVVPDWLCNLGKEKYTNLVNDLKSSDILTNVDIPVVAIVADAIAKMHQLNEVLKIEGMFITKLSDRGSENIVEHPATKLYKQYNAIYKQYLAELGLSPSSRAKLGVLNQQAKEEEQDPLLKILSE